MVFLLCGLELITTLSEDRVEFLVRCQRLILEGESAVNTILVQTDCGQIIRQRSKSATLPYA